MKRKQTFKDAKIVFLPVDNAARTMVAAMYQILQ